MRNLLKFYIGGEWVDPIPDATMPVLNPATEEQIGTVAMGAAPRWTGRSPTRKLPLTASPEAARKSVWRCCIAVTRDAVGDPAQEGDHIGPLFDPIQYDRLQAMIQKGLDEDEAGAIAIANDTPYGLAAYPQTGNPEMAARAA